MSKPKLLVIPAPAEAAGKRLDQFLVFHLPSVSRARIQQLISEKKVRVNDLDSNRPCACVAASASPFSASFSLLHCVPLPKKSPWRSSTKTTILR
ncbi:MAG TPA: S4 domain-containing protein [Terriglobales bacterium]|nr:S4 domain-containing protein [Terriglobales bacterium]